MARKLLIVNNGLKDLVGHYFETSVSIADAARKLGYKPILAVHVSCSREILPDWLECYPIFCTDHWMAQPPPSAPDLRGLLGRLTEATRVPIEAVLDGSCSLGDYLRARLEPIPAPKEPEPVAEAPSAPVEPPQAEQAPPPEPEPVPVVEAPPPPPEPEPVMELPAAPVEPAPVVEPPAPPCAEAPPEPMPVPCLPAPPVLRPGWKARVKELGRSVIPPVLLPAARLVWRGARRVRVFARAVYDRRWLPYTAAKAVVRALLPPFVYAALVRGKQALLHKAPPAPAIEVVVPTPVCPPPEASVPVEEAAPACAPPEPELIAAEPPAMPEASTAQEMPVIEPPPPEPEIALPPEPEPPPAPEAEPPAPVEPEVAVPVPEVDLLQQDLERIGAGHEFEYLNAFRRDLERLLCLTDADGEDHVFLPTAHGRELVAIQRLVSDLAPREAPTFHLEFRHSLELSEDPNWVHPYTTQHQLYFAHGRRRPPHPRIRVYTDTEELSEEYSRCSGLEFGTLPIPFRTHFLTERCRRPDEPLCLAFFGDARDEKGFPWLPDLVEAIHAEFVAAGKVRFVIQASMGAPQYNPGSQQALARLKAMDPRHVTLVGTDGPLTPDDYYRLVSRSDLLLCPYSPHTYRRRSSGTLTEGVAAGIPTVVPRGTWLERQQPPGTGETFADLNSFVEGVRRICADYAAYRERAQAFKDRWLGVHTPDNLVRELVRPAEGMGEGDARRAA